MPDNVCREIVERWLNSGGHREIGRQMNLPNSTVTNIVTSSWSMDKYRNAECKTRRARTDDVVMYTEYCKQQKLSN